MIFDEPIRGPWASEIEHCLEAIKWEREQLKWAKEKLLEENLRPVELKVFSFIVEDAPLAILIKEIELEQFRAMHFRWLETRESA